MSPADGRPIGPHHLRLPRGRYLLLGDRPRVMGILNITPDSFSDGGLWLEPDRALEHAQAMLDDGAEILDLGAESTRPGGGVYGAGARTLSPQEELDRRQRLALALAEIGDDARALAQGYRNETVVPEGGE